RKIGRIRHWKCLDVGSPLESLQQAVPGLNVDEAAELLARLGQAYWSIEGRITARLIAQQLIPGREWNLDSPTAADAAEWLVWMIDQKLSNTELLVATAAGHEIQSPLLDPLITSCFGVSNRIDAIEVLV